MTLTFDDLRPPCPHMDDTHTEWRRSVRGFVEREIMPFVDDWEEAGRIPRDLFKKAKEAGILGVGDVFRIDRPIRWLAAWIAGKLGSGQLDNLVSFFAGNRDDPPGLQISARR